MNMRCKCGSDVVSRDPIVQMPNGNITQKYHCYQCDKDWYDTWVKLEDIHEGLKELLVNNRHSISYNEIVLMASRLTKALK